MKIEVEIYEADGIKKGEIVGIRAFSFNGEIYRCNGVNTNLIDGIIKDRKVGRTPAIIKDVKKMRVGETFTVDDYFKRHPFGKYHPEAFQKSISQLIQDNVLLQIGNFEFKKIN